MKRKKEKKLEIISKHEKKEEKKREKRKRKERRKWEKPGVNLKKIIPIIFIISLLIGVAAFFFTKKWVNSLVSFLIIFVLSSIYIFIKAKLRESEKIKKMEAAFPDFLQLMSSNLRAGITVDRSLLLSARKEFAPLDKEITRLGKDLVTGKKIEEALQDMSKRIKSEKIGKVITLLISGIKSGGNLSVLLEETSASMRERGFVEKRAASNVLMYVIFIFFATAIGSPILFGLSSVLVVVLSDILSTIPDISTTATNINLPFTLSQINIPLNFIVYFALAFMIAIDILGSLVLGLVSKGEEKEGMKYVVPLIAISVTVFFTIRILLLSYFSDFLS